MANDGQPPPTPAGYVWVDERRLESIEAALSRLTHGQVSSSGEHVTTKGRLFTAFARVERLEGIAVHTARKVDLLLAHFKITPPEST